MTRIGLLIVALMCVSCSSETSGTESAATTPSPSTAPSSSTASTIATAPLATDACAADNDPLTVAKTFIVAAETGDEATIARCIYPTAPLSADLISIVASGGFLLDQVQPARPESLLKVGPSAVGFDFPLPPQPRGTILDADGQPRSAGDDYASGVLIAVTLEPNGLRYVTDILGYSSG
jgi:hypothetical protein